MADGVFIHVGDIGAIMVFVTDAPYSAESASSVGILMNMPVIIYFVSPDQGDAGTTAAVAIAAIVSWEEIQIPDLTQIYRDLCRLVIKPMYIQDYMVHYSERDYVEFDFPITIIDNIQLLPALC